MSKHIQTIETIAKAVVGMYSCPSGVIAQIIQEVGWDLKTPKDYKTGKESFNLGNIKGVGPAGTVTILTTEFYTSADVAKAEKSKKLVSKVATGNGKFKCQVYDQFKAYHSYAEALEDHLKFLKGPRYERAGVLAVKTPEEFAEALQEAGYATDPSYSQSIISIVNKWGLRKYDGQFEERGMVRMYQPSNKELLDATKTVLARLENKGEKSIDKKYRGQLNKGELSLDDAVGIVFLAVKDSLIVGPKQ